MNNSVTILVNSCDSYEDCWYPFFKLLKKYWPERKFPIVLNTETKTFNYEDMKIKTINVLEKHKNKNISWSKRLKDVLKRIDSKYILFMLDDFFITDFVNNEKINQIINWMNKDKNIGVFSLYPIEKNEYQDIQDNKYEDFVLRNKKGPYRFNCQIAIWDRKFLISCLRDFESPWDWELIGNRRSRRTNRKFYTLSTDAKLIFQYDFRNIGVIRRKWLLPKTAELFEKENIDVDFSIRNSVKEKKVKEENKLMKKIKYYLIRIRSWV